MKNRFSMQALQAGLRMAALAFMAWAGGLSLAWAQPAQLGALTVQNAYVKPTLPGQSNSAGYLKITNAGPADKLLSASSSSAGRVQLHFMGMQGDVMKMSEVSELALPSGQTVELKPGAYHLMIMGIKAPFNLGDQVKIKLKFEKAGELEMDFPVAQPGMPMSHHEHMAM